MKHLWLIIVFALLFAIAGCQQRLTEAHVFAPSGEPDHEVDFSHLDFSYPAGNWCMVWSEAWGEYYCQDGELHLVNRAENSSGQRITPMGGVDVNRNFQAETTIRSVSQSGAYGLEFRGPVGELCCYIFQVRPTGDFQFFIAAPVDISLVPWTHSEAIRQGGAANVLQIRAQDNHFTLYANGKQLISVEDDTLSDGSLGVVATENGHAAISSLKVWKLP